MTPISRSRSRFKLGEWVRDGALTGRLVVDLDTGEAFAPHGLAVWMQRYNTGVMIETEHFGVVHCAQPERLKPAIRESALSSIMVALLLLALVTIMFLVNFIDPWNGRRRGEGWACNGMPPSGQVCVKNVPTPSPYPSSTPAPG